MFIPWWAKGLAALALLAALYSGYRVYRHHVWVEGRDAALAAVKAQNGVAAAAAAKVQATTDACFDKGGSWDVSTGTCSQ
jgi:hypothetical protein